MLPGRSPQRRRHHGQRGQPVGGQGGGDGLEHRQVDGRVGHQPAPADLAPAGFELRLDQQHGVGAVGGRPGQRRGDEPERDERQVAHHEVDRFADVGQGEVAGVEALLHGHPGVVAQGPGQLAGADVDGHHRGGAALQEAVGEPAGRGAGVERPPTGHVDGETVEGRGQLLARPGRRSGPAAPRGGRARRGTRGAPAGRLSSRRRGPARLRWPPAPGPGTP